MTGTHKRLTYALLVLATLSITNGLIWRGGSTAGIAIFPFRLWMPVWVLLVLSARKWRTFGFRDIETNRKLIITFVIYTVIHIPLAMIVAGAGLTENLAALVNTWSFIIVGCSIAAVVSDWNDVRRCILLLLGLIVLEVCIGFWEHSTGNHLATSSIRINNLMQYGDFPTGTLYNPNNYSCLLFLFSVFTLTTLLDRNSLFASSMLKWFVLLSFALTIPVIVWSGSRANMASLCVFLGGIALLSKGDAIKSRLLKWGVAGVIGALAGATLVVDLPSLQKRFVDEISTVDQGASGRLELMNRSFHVMSQTGGLGAGPTSSNAVHRRLFGTRVTSAHSLPGELATSYGVIGLAVFGWMYWYNIASLWGFRRNCYCLAALLFWLTSPLSTGSASSTIDQPYYWIVVGLSWAILKVARLEQRSLQKRRETSAFNWTVDERQIPTRDLVNSPEQTA